MKHTRILRRGPWGRRYLVLIWTDSQDPEKIKQIRLKPVKLKHWENEVAEEEQLNLPRQWHCAYRCVSRLQKEMQLLQWKPNKIRLKRLCWKPKGCEEHQCQCKEINEEVEGWRRQSNSAEKAENKAAQDSKNKSQKKKSKWNAQKFVSPNCSSSELVKDKSMRSSRKSNMQSLPFGPQPHAEVPRCGVSQCHSGCSWWETDSPGCGPGPDDVWRDLFPRTH